MYFISIYKSAFAFCHKKNNRMMEKSEKDILFLTDLAEVDICEKSVTTRFSVQVREMLQNRREIFPFIYGLDHVKRRFVEILMTGNGVLLKGEFGVGKTELARAIFSILQEYYLSKPVYTPVGCPVRENAINLYNHLLKDEPSSLNNVCPVCRHNYLDKKISPSHIKIQRVYLTEGSGFARIQGNEDIEPERILGMYHLTRYAEIGDPFDPRVLEPGKIAQGSGGVIFVDELGLLNKEAQYAFIQGLQEKHFTPTNSRMTFPIDFLFVSTTNNINEFQIHKAIQNRLVGVRIDRVSPDDEVAIVKKELDSKVYEVFFPELFLQYLVESVRKLNNLTVFLGPRSSIRSAQIAFASAAMEGRSIVSYCDVKEGIYAEILGQADDENIEESQEMLNNDFPSISDYLKKKIPVMDKVSSLLDISDDVTYIIDIVDEDIIGKMKEYLGETEKKRDVINIYLEAYLKGCLKDAD